MSTSPYIKPLAAAVTAGALDRFWLQNSDTRHNLYYAGAVGGGVLISSMVTPSLPSLLPAGILPAGMGDEQTLTARLAEIGISAGAGYLLNTKVLNNGYTRDDMMKQLAIIGVSSFVGEYVSDYMTNRPLSYLA